METQKELKPFAKDHRAASSADQTPALSPAPRGMDMEPVGDHPALDMMNTVVRLESGLVDLWQSDADVLRWLVRTDLLKQNIVPEFKRDALLRAARSLRELVRVLVVQRKANTRLNTTPLNAFLAKGSSHAGLVRSNSGLAVERHYDLSTPEALLAPLAESAADLLATADFALVRACEGEQCVLWFYDRTKAHRRRWCSMGVCGNRAKVAKFRAAR